MIFVTKGIASGDILNPHDRRDIAGVAGIQIFPLVGLDLNNPTDTLTLVRAWIVDGITL